MVGHSHGLLVTHCSCRRAFDCLAGLLAPENEHAFKWLAKGFAFLPPRQFCSDSVEKRNPSFTVRSNHSIADTGQSDLEALALLAFLLFRPLTGRVFLLCPTVRLVLQLD